MCPELSRVLSSSPFFRARAARPRSTLRATLVITPGPTRTTFGNASSFLELRDPRGASCRRPLVRSSANMAVTRAYTVPWPPLLARLADDSSDADAKRRDAKLSGADAAATAAAATAADADADAATVRRTPTPTR